MNRVLTLLVLALMTNFLSAQLRDYDEIEKELQKAQGEDRVMLLIELCQQDINNDQDLTRKRAKEALSISKELDFRRGIGNSLRYIGLSYHFVGITDSARVYYLRCKDYFDKPKSIGWSYYNIASLFEYESEYDSAWAYLDLAETYFDADSAKVELGSVLSMRGTIMTYKGDWSEAPNYFSAAMKLFDEANDLLRKADMVRQLGSASGVLLNHDKAIEYYKEAAALYMNNNDSYYYSQALFDIGTSYYNLSQLDSSRNYLLDAIEISKKAGNYDVIIGSLSELSEVYIKQKLDRKAIQVLDEAEEYLQGTEDLYRWGKHLLSKGRVLIRLKDFGQAKKALEEGLSISQKIDAAELQKAINYELRNFYADQSDYQRAYQYFESYSILKDSIYSVEKTESLQDALVKYETERKEKELVIVKAENDRRKWRNRLLTLGLLSGLIVIYGLISRNKKNKLIYQKETELEIERRKIAEQELEFKKKELTAKALQLASKNEFLQNLEVQVKELKSSMDEKVSKTSEKISRMINYDAVDDREWEQFSKEFSSIHQDFLDRLKNEFGSFSKSETRLISLLKMNLSSKDIANTLRISDEGIKKARYRLRKKMNLKSEVDIQGFLINY